MTYLISILILAGCFYIAWRLMRPVIKVFRTLNKIKKGDMSVLDDLFGQPGAQHSQSAFDKDGRRKPGWSNPKPVKKKITDDVGEYVRFTDIKVAQQHTEEQTADGTTYTYTREEQVTDAEWVDL